MTRFRLDLVVHPPQPLVFASRSSRFDNSTARNSAPAKARCAKVRVAPRAFACAPWLREAHRSAIPRPGRGRERAGSSDNAALMSWSDKRAAGDMGQSARWSTSRVQSARSLPLAHAPVTPLAPAHNETLSERPRPPAPAALRGPSQRVRPGGQLLAQLVHPSQSRRSARHGPCMRTSRAALRSYAQPQDATPLRLIQRSIHALEAGASRCCNSPTSVSPRKPSRPFSSARARL